MCLTCNVILATILTGIECPMMAGMQGSFNDGVVGRPVSGGARDIITVSSLSARVARPHTVAKCEFDIVRYFLKSEEHILASSTPDLSFWQRRCS